MKVSTRMEGNELTLQIAGELDALTVRELQPMLPDVLARAGEGRNLVVDLSELRLLDSSGVGALVFLLRGRRAVGGGFDVRGATGQPLAILRLMKLDHIFHAPLAALAPPAPAPAFVPPVPVAVSPAELPLAS